MNIVKKQVNLKRNIKSKLERHPVPILGKDYRVKIIYKNTKIIELDVDGKNIIISLPNQYKKVENTNVLDLAIDKMYEQIAKVEIERAMEKTRIMLGFAPEEYEIEKMKELGRCENRNITIYAEIVKKIVKIQRYDDQYNSKRSIYIYQDCICDLLENLLPNTLHQEQCTMLPQDLLQTQINIMFQTCNPT